MPNASSIRDLIDALKSRETKITKALDDLFGSAGALNTLKTHASWNAAHPLRTPYILGSNRGDPLPQWARDELTVAATASGLVTDKINQDEVRHIELWDPNQKEKVREALVKALDGQIPPLKFHWELHGGDSEETDVPNNGADGLVIFRTPQSYVDAPGPWPTIGSIKIKVGP